MSDETSQQQSIHDFIADNQIEMQVVKLLRRPDRNEVAWDKTASHWQIVITQVGRGYKPEVVTNYSMGSAHKGRPKIEDVLDSLAMDAMGVEDARNFKE